MSFKTVVRFIQYLSLLLVLRSYGNNNNIIIIINNKNVYCLSVFWMLSVSCLLSAGSCRQRLSGICYKIVNQHSTKSESLILICTVGNTLGRVPDDYVVCL